MTSPRGMAYLPLFCSTGPVIMESSTILKVLAPLRLNEMGSSDFLKASHLLPHGLAVRRAASSESVGCSLQKIRELLISQATPLSAVRPREGAHAHLAANSRPLFRYKTQYYIYYLSVRVVFRLLEPIIYYYIGRNCAIRDRDNAPRNFPQNCRVPARAT